MIRDLVNSLLASIKDVAEAARHYIILGTILLIFVFLLLHYKILPKINPNQSFIVLLLALLILILIITAIFLIQRKEKSSRQIKIRDTSNQLAKTNPDGVIEDRTGALFCFKLDSVNIKYCGDSKSYSILFHKIVRNIGTKPMTKVYARIAVDVYPDDKQRSKKYYRKNPLNLDKISFKCWDGEGESLAYHIEYDYDANKEIYILFQSKEQEKPLYPGKEREIFYSFNIPDTLWGPYIQRHIRCKNEACKVIITFSSAIKVAVWGIQNTQSSDSEPIMPEIKKTLSAEEVSYTWTRKDPPIHAKYRIMWKFLG